MEDAGAKARLVGINHIALEVGEIDAALEFYGRILSFELRGRVGSRMAFIDAGDQFIALSAGRNQPRDDARHFGLVVDDAGAVRRSLTDAGVEILPGSGLDFRDPWGNRIQIVQYDEVQFTKTPGVLRSIGLDGLGKTHEALAELRKKGIDDVTQEAALGDQRCRRVGAARRPYPQPVLLPQLPQV